MGTRHSRVERVYILPNDGADDAPRRPGASAPPVSSVKGHETNGPQPPPQQQSLQTVHPSSGPSPLPCAMVAPSSVPQREPDVVDRLVKVVHEAFGDAPSQRALEAGFEDVASYLRAVAEEKPTSVAAHMMEFASKRSKSSTQKPSARTQSESVPAHTAMQEGRPAQAPPKNTTQEVDVERLTAEVGRLTMRAKELESKLSQGNEPPVGKKPTGGLVKADLGFGDRMVEGLTNPATRITPFYDESTYHPDRSMAALEAFIRRLSSEAGFGEQPVEKMIADMHSMIEAWDPAHALTDTQRAEMGVIFVYTYELYDTWPPQWGYFSERGEQVMLEKGDCAMVEEAYTGQPRPLLSEQEQDKILVLYAKLNDPNADVLETEREVRAFLCSMVQQYNLDALFESRGWDLSTRRFEPGKPSSVELPDELERLRLREHLVPVTLQNPSPVAVKLDFNPGTGDGNIVLPSAKAPCTMFRSAQKHYRQIYAMMNKAMREAQGQREPWVCPTHPHELYYCRLPPSSEARLCKGCGQILLEANAMTVTFAWSCIRDSCDYNLCEPCLERLAGRKGIEFWRYLIFSFDVALRGIPRTVNLSKVYRGINIKFDAQVSYAQGKIVIWAAFTSSSLSKSVAEEFIKVKSNGELKDGTVFIIDPMSCKSIEKYSRFPREREMVFPSNTKFQVTKNLGLGMQMIMKIRSQIMELTEIVDEQKILRINMEAIVRGIDFAIQTFAVHVMTTEQTALTFPAGFDKLGDPDRRAVSQLIAMRLPHFQTVDLMTNATELEDFEADELCGAIAQNPRVTALDVRSRRWPRSELAHKFLQPKGNLQALELRGQLEFNCRPCLLAPPLLSHPTLAHLTLSNVHSGSSFAGRFYFRDVGDLCSVAQANPRLQSLVVSGSDQLLDGFRAFQKDFVRRLITVHQIEALLIKWMLLFPAGEGCSDAELRVVAFMALERMCNVNSEKVRPWEILEQCPSACTLLMGGSDEELQPVCETVARHPGLREVFLHDTGSSLGEALAGITHVLTHNTAVRKLSASTTAVQEYEFRCVEAEVRANQSDEDMTRGDLTQRKLTQALLQLLAIGDPPGVTARQWAVKLERVALEVSPGEALRVSVHPKGYNRREPRFGSQEAPPFVGEDANDNTVFTSWLLQGAAAALRVKGCSVTKLCIEGKIPSSCIGLLRDAVVVNQSLREVHVEGAELPSAEFLDMATAMLTRNPPLQRCILRSTPQRSAVEAAPASPASAREVEKAIIGLGLLAKQLLGLPAASPEASRTVAVVAVPEGTVQLSEGALRLSVMPAMAAEWPEKAWAAIRDGLHSANSARALEFSGGRLCPAVLHELPSLLSSPTCGLSELTLSSCCFSSMMQGIHCARAALQFAKGKLSCLKVDLHNDLAAEGGTDPDKGFPGCMATAMALVRDAMLDEKVENLSVHSTVVQLELSKGTELRVSFLPRALAPGLSVEPTSAVPEAEVKMSLQKLNDPRCKLTRLELSGGGNDLSPGMVETLCEVLCQLTPQHPLTEVSLPQWNELGFPEIKALTDAILKLRSSGLDAQTPWFTLNLRNNRELATDTPEITAWADQIFAAQPPATTRFSPAMRVESAKLLLQLPLSPKEFCQTAVDYPELIMCVAYDRVTRRMALSSADGSVQVMAWDEARPGQAAVLWQLPARKGPSAQQFCKVGFHHSGKYLCTAGYAYVNNVHNLNVEILGVTPGAPPPEAPLYSHTLEAFAACQHLAWNPTELRGGVAEVALVCKVSSERNDGANKVHIGWGEIAQLTAGSWRWTTLPEVGDCQYSVAYHPTDPWLAVAEGNKRPVTVFQKSEITPMNFTYVKARTLPECVTGFYLAVSPALLCVSGYYTDVPVYDLTGVDLATWQVKFRWKTGICCALAFSPSYTCLAVKHSAEVVLYDLGHLPFHNEFARPTPARSLEERMSRAQTPSEDCDSSKVWTVPVSGFGNLCFGDHDAHIAVPTDNKQITWYDFRSTGSSKSKLA
eukprot:RCo002214